MKLLLSITFLAVAASGQNNSRKDWWQTGNFYQIYPRSFMDSDGDGVGDLKGIKEKMSYLKDIGMDGVWLSPIFDTPMADFGYDISDYYTVYPKFGTMDDMQELINRSNELGIKLILDFVPNHTSEDHEWFKASVNGSEEYRDYYVWHPGKPNPNGGRPLVPNNWVSAFHSEAWTWNEQRQAYYLHQFLAEQPDLNYRNPKVVEAMKNVLRFWLLKGIMGFRIDAVPYLFEVEADANGNFPDEPETGACSDPLNQCYLSHIYTQNRIETFEMVTQWRAVLDEVKEQNGGPTRVLMVEAYAPLTEVVKIYGVDGKPGAQVPFNFEILNNLGPTSNAAAFKTVIDNYLRTIPEGTTPNWVQGNHDQKRSASRLGEEKADAVNILLQVLPGAAVTYYGEELAAKDVFVSWQNTVDPQACTVGDKRQFHAASRDPARTPMIWEAGRNAGFSNASRTWLPVARYARTENVAIQENAEKSHLKVFKSLMALRKQDILKYGSYNSTLVNDDVLIVERKHGNETLLAILNLGFSDRYFDTNDFLPNIPQELTIVTASVESDYNAGDHFNAAEVFIAKGVGYLLSG